MPDAPAEPVLPLKPLVPERPAKAMFHDEKVPLPAATFTLTSNTYVPLKLAYPMIVPSM